jgi:flagellar hook-length control protein FliK
MTTAEAADAALAGTTNGSVAQGRPASELPELPAQAARPEVRAVATDTSSGSERAGDTSDQLRHGEQVAALARAANAQANGVSQSEQTAAARAADGVDAVAGQQAAAATTKSVEKGSARAVDTAASASIVLPASETGSGQTAGARVESALMAAADASLATSERAQSARDTVGQGQSRAMPGAQGQPVVNLAPDGDADPQSQSAAQSRVGLADGAAAQATNSQLSGAQAQSMTASDGENAVAQSQRSSVNGGEVRSSTEGNATLAAQGASTATAAATAGARPDAMSQAAAMAARLQDPQWGRAMGQRAVMMAQYGPRVAEIQLDPPELGAMQIRIHVGAQDQVSVTFSSPNAAVRDAIEQQIPRLREMFAEQGLDLNQSSVSDQSTRERGDGGSGGQGGGRGGEGYADGDGGESVLAARATPVGLVDYYA